jgi:hypothetical protein
VLRSITTTVSVVTLASSIVGGGLAVSLTACGAPQQKMVATTKDDGVPANSASEQRLAMEGKPKTTSAAPAEDPTQPLTTPLNEGAGGAAGAGAPGTATGAGAGAAGGGASGKGGAKGTKGPKEKEPPAPKGGGGKVTKAECKQTFDKYIDLTLASDSRFDGIPPEMIAQLKEQALSQAQSQKGDPCSTQDVTRTQYNCAISAPTTAAWQRCMK